MKAKADETPAHSFKANDTAILYLDDPQQDIVEVLEVKDVPGIVRIKTSKGEYETVTPYDLTPCVTVSIQPDDTAKELNRFGPEPVDESDEEVGINAKVDFLIYLEDHEKWKTAEEKLRTLPWLLTARIMEKYDPADLKYNWHAYSFTNKEGAESFILVSPIKDEA